MMSTNQNSLERCLTSLERTLNSPTGLPMLKKYIHDTYSGTEHNDYILIVDFLVESQLVLSDKLSNAEKFAKAKELGEAEENRSRQKININAVQLQEMQTSEDIAELKKTVKDVFDRNSVSGSTIDRVFVEFREEALKKPTICGESPKKKKKKGCIVA